MEPVCCLCLQKAPSQIFFALSQYSYLFYGHIIIHCYFVRDFRLKIPFILLSSTVFISIVLINYANQVHGRVNLAHQNEAQLSKLVNKGRCWENKSSSLVASIGLQGGGLTNSHFLGNQVQLFCAEGEFLLTPNTCIEML